MKLVFTLVLIANLVFSQETKPKLVVGIVVDQMRNDLIYRYWNNYGNGGFKRLVNEGFYFKNAHYNYIPTYTGPGHSSIYTGTTPRTHGIIGNEWFVKETGKNTYCVIDTTVKSIGCNNNNGKKSPKNQLSSTIGDEIKMSSNGKAKVIAVALKDRSAVLPAGHAANAAYWFDDASGNFISSGFYVNDLPQWLKAFNEKKLAKIYLEKGWNTLYPIANYTNSIADDNRYEETPNKKAKPVFPYEYKTFIEKNMWGIIKATPFGNDYTKDIALECIKNEELGKDDITDLFSISFSSPDAVQHAYGPRAIEVEDVYLRLDKNLEEILNYLDREVGKNNYSIFLTADHGGADVPNHLLDNKIPAGYFNNEKLANNLKTYFKTNYGIEDLLADISNEQIFINEKKLSNINLSDLEEKLCAYLVTIPGIAEAYSSKSLKFSSFEQTDYRTLLQNGYNHKLSGNVAFVYQPGWMDHAEKGTTHGAGYNYDTHVPVIFFGSGVKKGSSFNYTTITQIAPTVCELIQVNQPNSTTSEPLNDFFK